MKGRESMVCDVRDSIDRQLSIIFHWLDLDGFTCNSFAYVGKKGEPFIGAKVVYGHQQFICPAWSLNKHFETDYSVVLQKWSKAVLNKIFGKDLVQPNDTEADHFIKHFRAYIPDDCTCDGFQMIEDERGRKLDQFWIRIRMFNAIGKLVKTVSIAFNDMRSSVLEHNGYGPAAKLLAAKLLE